MRALPSRVLLVLGLLGASGCLAPRAPREVSPAPGPTPHTTRDGCTTGRAEGALVDPPAARPPQLLGALVPQGSPLSPAAPQPPPWEPLPKVAPSSSPLPSGFFNPMPGGLLSGYSADTGLDIAGYKMPVYAVAAGTIDYAEAGHTRWTSKNDSPYTLRLRFDRPVRWKTRTITHAYYGHLSSLDVQVREGQTPKIHVEAGQRLGVSGWANRSPHLHLGLLLDDHVEQDRWEFILDEAEVREALRVGPNGRRLPR